MARKPARRGRKDDLERLARRAVGGDIEAASRLLEEVARQSGIEPPKPNVWLVWRQTYDEGHETLSAWSAKEAALEEIGRRVQKEIDELLHGGDLRNEAERLDYLASDDGREVLSMLAYIDDDRWAELADAWNEFTEQAYREKAQVKFWIDGGFVLDSPDAPPRDEPGDIGRCGACSEDVPVAELEDDGSSQMICESCRAIRDKTDKTMEEMEHNPGACIRCGTLVTTLAEMKKTCPTPGEPYARLPPKERKKVGHSLQPRATSHEITSGSATRRTRRTRRTSRT